MVFGSFYEKSLFFPVLQLQRKEDLKRQTKTFLSSEFRAMHTAWKIFLCSCANVDSLSPWNAQPWGPAVCNPKPGLIQHSSVTLPNFPEKIFAKIEGVHDVQSCKIIKANTDIIIVEIIVIIWSTRVKEEKSWLEKLKFLKWKTKTRER